MKATNGLDLPLSLADLLRYRLAPLGSGGAEVRIRRRVTNQRQVKFATDSLLREVDSSFQFPARWPKLHGSCEMRDQPAAGSLPVCWCEPYPWRGTGSSNPLSSSGDACANRRPLRCAVLQVLRARADLPGSTCRRYVLPRRTESSQNSPLEETVLSELVSAPKFPGNRQKYRDFQHRSLRIQLVARNPEPNSVVYDPIPYASEQGSYFGLVGN